MKRLVQLAATAALAVMVHVAAPDAARAATVPSASHYCLSYNEGGIDCGFTSLAQCHASADGIGAECSVDYAGQAPRLPQPHAFR
jgi:hypothetical protein